MHPVKIQTQSGSVRKVFWPEPVVTPDVAGHLDRCMQLATWLPHRLQIKRQNSFCSQHQQPAGFTRWLQQPEAQCLESRRKTVGAPSQQHATQAPSSFQRDITAPYDHRCECSSNGSGEFNAQTWKEQKSVPRNARGSQSVGTDPVATASTNRQAYLLH